MSSSFVPVSKSGKFKRLCRWLTQKAGWWANKYLVAPLLLSLMPSIVMLILVRDQYRSQLESELGFTFSNLGLLITAILSLLWPAVLRAIWAFVEAKSVPERELTRDDLLLVLNAVSIVIGDKLDRFSAEVRRQQSTPPHASGADIFQRITQPDAQVRALVNGVHAIFSALDTSTRFRVGLLDIVNDKPVRWAQYFPAGRVARTTPDELSVSSSTVMRCISRKRTVVVDDIQRELDKKKKEDRSYVKCNTDVNEEGCQLCYPIFDKPTAKVRFVLTIAGSRKDALCCRLTPIYDWILEQFSMRIQLEACLSTLKETIHEDPRDSIPTAS